MDWTSIVWIIAIGLMIVWLLPRAKHMAQNSPKGSASDWMSFIVPIIGVVLFVIVLIMLA